MKKYLLLALVGVIIIVVAVQYQGRAKTNLNMKNPLQINPINHATMVMNWGEQIIYTDPVGGNTAFQGQAPADIVLVTDIHGDHFNTSTLESIIGRAVLIVPQAVKDLLPADLAAKSRVVKNGEKITVGNLSIEAIPMYNLPESKDAFHTKGRGNGYVLERDGFRVYIAGDTAGIPEMRALKNINIAFVPMNLPYTMSVEDAADAVLAFKPKVVYPYHYRGTDGLSDVGRFKALVNAGNKDIEVILAKWY